MTSVDDAVARARSLRHPSAGAAADAAAGASQDGEAVAAAEERWVDVIAEHALVAEIGVPALIEGDAVAVFKTHTGELFAVSNHDPVTGASVMARGIVGTRGEIPVVASPMYKHVFDLRTGRCLDDESKTLRPYQVRVTRGVVQVRGVDDGRR